MIRSFGISLWLSAALFSAVAGSNFFSNQSTAGGAFAFVEDYAGSTAFARAQSGVSTSQRDLFAVLLNPASPAAINQNHDFALAWKSGAVQTHQGSFAWAFPWQLARLQLTYNNHFHSAIAETDINGATTGHEFSPYSQSVAVSAQVPTTHFVVGVSLKHLLDQLSDLPGDQSAMAWGMDWGLRLRNNSPRWGAGLAVLNLGNQFRAYTENGVNYLPLNTIIQVGGHLNLVVPRGTTWMLDLRLERYGPTSVHTAVDYTINPWLTVHAGLQRSIPEIMYLLNMFFTEAEAVGGHWDMLNLGAEVHTDKWTLNYGMAWLTENQGLRHQISLGYFL